ncbi:MAG: hypothetical protein MUP21_10885, partial [Dehalococcoidia bacterium]|nr:hypothetical protein [Dehalococcoidia bacterium]
MRNFDAAQQSQSVKTSAVAAIKSIFPVVGKIRTMQLDNVWVDEKEDPNDYVAQAKTKIQEGTWGSPVYASLSLIENASGRVVDKAPKIRLFLLPIVTDRSSYIVAGNEYQVNNQLRLKTGVYTIRKQNGELKTQVNLAKGKNFDLGFNEASGIFSLQKVGGGQTNIPLYPILTYLGISPSLISQAWGAKLQSVNQKADPKSVARAETAFKAKSVGLSEYFKKTEISSDTTKMVLGTAYDKVDGPMLLACSKNLLEVQLGKRDPVDRDSLAFKELHGIEDFIRERLEKNKNELSYKILRQIDSLRRTKVTQIVNPGLFSGVVQSFFTQDDKSSTPEQTNPLEMLSGGYRATFMGSGGITSHHAIKDEVRQIHPSHYGFIDPVHTPESDRIGVNLHLPTGVVKDGKDLRVQLNNAKSGARELLNVTESWEKYVAFPGQKGDTLKAMYQGKIVSVPRSKIDFYTPHAVMLFSPSTNLVPFLPANQGNRAMMASKMLEQAIGLKHREAPLVQVGISPEMTMEQFVGKDIAAHAPDAGTIKKVTADFITLATAKGDVKINTYNNFTLNRKSYLNHTALVKEGDTVAKGQLLAESNYTRDGTLALGTNLRAAYIPYKGYNFEDGIVISQSASEKLTSEHIYKKTYEISENSVMKLPSFRAFYPNAVTAANAAKLDADGVIKKGQRVKTGDVIIAALQKRAPDARIAVVSKTLAERPKDASIYWTAEDEGIVTEIQRGSKSVSVFIKTEERARIGDKLSGRMGNKGIITKILPDSQTPRDGSGKPVDILLNPHGVIGRINIGQIYESAAGKAALKNGAPYKVENFTGQDYLGTTRKFLKQSGVKDKEELFDPETGKSLGNVHVGNPYILKLFKQSAGNFSVRQGGPGSTYDTNMQPVKAGGEEGSKSLDLLTMYSMLSHGARANLQEMSTLKSNQNDEYWKALRGGQQLPPPKAPFIYDKFIAYLKGAGIDVVKDGTKSTLGPLTDSHALEMSSGAVQKPHFYHAKDFQPVKGGFFDTRVFGGITGKKWGHLDLKEPVVNPVFEDAARNLLGLSGKFDEVVGGRLFVQKDGSLTKESDGGLTSGAGIERLLKGIDVDAQLGKLAKKGAALTGTKLNDVNKKLRYLTALKTLNIKPHEAYIRRNMAVLPPVYRPIYPLPNGSMASSDVNTLYQKVGVINTMMHLPVMALLPEEEKANIRQDLYNHVKGVAGLMDVTIKGKPKDGLISQIKGGTGGQPKEGLFISKLLSKQQDFVGRGTIIPEPSLGIDEMAMPEDMAWKL